MTPPAEAATSGKDPLWTREFVIASAVNMLTMGLFYLLMTTMAVYAAQRFAASDSLAGLASSGFIIGAVAARLAAGRLVAILGPRRTLVWSLVMYTVLSAAYLVAVNLPLLLTLRVAHGIAFGLANTAVTTIAQLIIPSRRRGEGTGYFNLGAPLAAALGPAAGLLLISAWGYDALFLAAVATSGLAFAVTLLLPEHPVTRDVTSRGLGWGTFIDRDTLPLATVMLWLGVANASVISFVHPFAESLGIGAAAGTYFGVQAAAVITTRLFAGRVQDRLGDSWVVYPGLVINAVGLVMLARVESVPDLVLAGALTGLGFGSLTPSLQAAAVRMTQPQNLGLAITTFYLMLDIGTGFGPPLLGMIVAAWDYRTMYLVLAVLLLLTAGQYHLVHGRRVRRA